MRPERAKALSEAMLLPFLGVRLSLYFTQGDALGYVLIGLSAHIWANPKLESTSNKYG